MVNEVSEIDGLSKDELLQRAQLANTVMQETINVLGNVETGLRRLSEAAGLFGSAALARSLTARASQLRAASQRLRGVLDGSQPDSAAKPTCRCERCRR